MDALTVAQVARLKNYGLQHIRRLCRQGKIQSQRINARTYVITDPEVIAQYRARYSRKPERGAK